MVAKRHLFLACLCGGVIASTSFAQDKEVDMNSKIYTTLEREAVAPKLAWRAQTVEEHRAWRESFRTKLVELLGRTPDPVPLEVTWSGISAPSSSITEPLYGNRLLCPLNPSNPTTAIPPTLNVGIP